MSDLHDKENELAHALLHKAPPSFARDKTEDWDMSRARSLKTADAPPVADGGGLRHNSGKVQLELIPAEWTWALAMVLTRGAAKYAPRNWERGMKWSYPVGCALRHIAKFVCGERYDKETGCHHLAMAAWNCLALMTYDIRGIGENDLGPADVNWLEQVAAEPGPELKARMAKNEITAAVKHPAQ